MKKLIYLLVMLPMLSACDDGENSMPKLSGELNTIFICSYVSAYDGGTWVFSKNEPYETGFCVLVDTRDEERPVYVSSDITKKEDENTAAFWQIAQRNGDTSYNEMEVSMYTRRCYVDNLKAIHVVCTNESLGEAYRAGTLLDGIVSARFISYGAYVDSGYTLNEMDVSLVEKRLPALTETDLKMIDPRIVFTLHEGAAFAPRTTYSLRVTLVTTDDEEIVVEGKVFYY